MERDIWRCVTAALKRLPRTRRSGQRYSNRDVLAILLWAALHDRCILWACRRRNWPMQAWRRRLPDQSTMSRRLRDESVLEDLERLLHLLQTPPEEAEQSDVLARVDGKPLAVSMFSRDKDAKVGWGAGIYQRGYKLHGLVDNAKRLIGGRVEPMNTPESLTAAELLRRNASRLNGKRLLLGDGSYDTNSLHAAAAEVGLQLLAPRRRPGTSLSKSHRQHAGRVVSAMMLEGDPALASWQRKKRACVEHYFGGLVSGAGLHTLPPWVRTLPRVRVWVAAKLALNAARLARIRTQVA